MNKIEFKLEYLTPYLAHKIKVFWHEESKPVWMEIGTHEAHHVVRNVNDNNPTTKRWKPIFRPLRDLTIEIEVNGEKFIPLLKIADLFLIGENPKLITSTNGGAVVTHNSNGSELELLTQHIHNGCFEVTLCKTGNIVRFNQLEALNKLFEWHFNVLDLPQELWIDINELNDKK